MVAERGFTCLVQRRDLLTGRGVLDGHGDGQQQPSSASGSRCSFWATNRRRWRPSLVEGMLMFRFLYVLGDAAASGRQPLLVLLQHRRAAGQEPSFSLAAGAGVGRQRGGDAGAGRPGRWTCWRPPRRRWRCSASAAPWPALSLRAWAATWAAGGGQAADPVFRWRCSW